MERDSDILGRVAEVTTPLSVDMVAFTGSIPQIGDYVIVESPEVQLLGLITWVERGSVEISGRNINFAENMEKILKIVREPSHWSRAKIKLLGAINLKEDHVELSMPRSPPPTCSIVKRAPKSILDMIFGPNSGHVKLGHLLTREEVNVYADMNRIVSRHLAVLAVTGAGKSNAIAVIAREALKLGAPLILFDMHSEYTGLDFGSGEIVEVEPFVDPNMLSLEETSRLLGISWDKAAKQYIYLRFAWKVVRKAHARDLFGTLMRECDESPPEEPNYLDGISAIISKMIRLLEGEGLSDSNVINFSVENGGRGILSALGERVLLNKKDRDSLYSLKSRLQMVEDRYSFLLKPNNGEIIDYMDFSRLVIVKLGSLDTEMADLVVGHALSTLLHRAKSAVLGLSNEGVPYPALAIIEEAHLLIPADLRTYTKEIASRIAREGRKFGVGLALVSQRPKRLDPDVLSQMVNKIVLRVIEPEDQAYVRRASEFLSEDLMEYLPSLNVGEAILVGPMVQVPAIIKFDKVEGKVGGSDIDAVGRWRSRSAPGEQIDLDDGYGGMLQ